VTLQRGDALGQGWTVDDASASVVRVSLSVERVRADLWRRVAQGLVVVVLAVAAGAGAASTFAWASVLWPVFGLLVGVTALWAADVWRLARRVAQPVALEVSAGQVRGVVAPRGVVDGYVEPRVAVPVTQVQDVALRRFAVGPSLQRLRVDVTLRDGAVLLGPEALVADGPADVEAKLNALVAALRAAVARA